MKVKRRQRKASIMIIPMIDIIFFLLVFFMMNMLSMAHIKMLPVHLPVASTATVQKAKPITITITKDNVVYVNKEHVPLEEVKKRLSEISSIDNTHEVILNIDKIVPHGVVVAVMDVIKEAGMQDITIGTK